MRVEMPEDHVSECLFVVHAEGVFGSPTWINDNGGRKVGRWFCYAPSALTAGVPFPLAVNAFYFPHTVPFLSVSYPRTFRIAGSRESHG